AVRRPGGRGGALREVGDRECLATLGGDQVDLRALLLLLLRLLVRLAGGGTDEGDPAAVRRPAGGRIAGARGERARRRAAVGRDDPQRRVVAVLLLLDRHPDEEDLPAVRRDPGIGDPDEPEEVRLGDEALPGSGHGRGKCQQGESDNESRRGGTGAVGDRHRRSSVKNDRRDPTAPGAHASRVTAPGAPG